MTKFLKCRFEANKIADYLLFFLMLLLFMFPFFKENIHSILLILLGLVSLTNSLIHNKLLFKPNLLFFCIPFFIVLIDYVFRGGGIEPIGKTLFSVFFPFIFSNISNRWFSDKKINLYNTVLQISTLLVCISYLIQFFIDFDYADLFTYHYNIPKFRHYIYSEMKIFKIHPTYLTFILTYCSVVSLKKIFKKGIGIDLLLVLFYIVFSVFLMTKLNLLFQLSVIFCFLFFQTGLNFFKRAIIFGLLIFAAVSTVLYMPSLLNRFTEIPRSLNKKPEGLAFDSTNIRVAIYQCDVELVKENYIVGVGFNRIQESLNTCYSKNYSSDFYKNNNYLSHNYFFYILISSGIFGLFFFLVFLFNLFKLTKKINTFTLYVVVLNVFLMCFIEDFFYRQFGLFSFLLLFFAHYKNYIYNDDKTEKVKNEVVI